MSCQSARRCPYPLLRSLDELASSTLAIPEVGALEARVGDAREGSTRREDVGVRSHKHVRHHSTGRRASGEDTRRVDTPVRDGIANGGNNAEGVAASVVCQCLSGVHVPALTGAGGSVGVEENVAVLVGEGGVLGAGEVCLGGTRAVVHGDDERGWVRELGGLVVEHADVRWVGAPVVELYQLSGGGERAGYGQCDSGEDSWQEHFGMRTVSWMACRHQPTSKRFYTGVKVILHFDERAVASLSAGRVEGVTPERFPYRGFAA